MVKKSIIADDKSGEVRPGITGRDIKALKQPDIEDKIIHHDSFSKETVGAIFHSIRAVFTHPVSPIGEFIFLLLCSIAFYFAPVLRTDYHSTPTNIIIVVLFIMIVVVLIRLFYVGDLVAGWLKKYWWIPVGIFMGAYAFLAIVSTWLNHFG